MGILDRIRGTAPVERGNKRKSTEELLTKIDELRQKRDDAQAILIQKIDDSEVGYRAPLKANGEEWPSSPRESVHELGLRLDTAEAALRAAEAEAEGE